MKTTPTASKPWTEKKRKAMMKRIEANLAECSRLSAIIRAKRAQVAS